MPCTLAITTQETNVSTTGCIDGVIVTIDTGVINAIETADFSITPNGSVTGTLTYGSGTPAPGASLCSLDIPASLLTTIRDKEFYELNQPLDLSSCEGANVTIAGELLEAFGNEGSIAIRSTSAAQAEPVQPQSASQGITVRLGQEPSTPAPKEKKVEVWVWILLGMGLLLMFLGMASYARKAKLL